MKHKSDRVDVGPYVAPKDAKHRMVTEYEQRNTSTFGYCYSVEDGLDGYFMHDPRCPYWPRAAVGGYRCVK